MRLIDADALQVEYKKHHDGKRLLLIDVAPTKEPERKKGKWINSRCDEGHWIADCDQCGWPLQWYDDEPTPKFCCMCGADMREVAE